jgi:Cdc6-like AAA superfamily ATPase
MTQTHNPFIPAGPVPPERFINREREVDAILNRLLVARPGSSAIYGEARIGKTSLLHYLKSEKVRKDWDITPEGFTFIYTDCGGIDDPLRLNFWKTMYIKLRNKIQDPQAAQVLEARPIRENDLTLSLQEMFNELSKLNHRIVILLDEFENVIRKDVPLLRTLRALIAEQLVSLIVSTTVYLPDLVRDIDLGGGQTFERPFDIRELGYFSRDETNSLIDQALEGSAVTFDSQDRQFIWDVSQGHPFKVQFACSRLFEAKIFA